MAKIIFEADDNRKGIIDKLFVKNEQKVQAGDKIANVITQNKVYEIKTPEAGEVQNLLAYENKVIKSGDILLEIVPLKPILNEENYDARQIYNTSSFGVSSKYNANNIPSEDSKKTETEIFREELIETLLAREVAGENPTNDFENTIELNWKVSLPKRDWQNIFQDNINTTSILLKDKVENVMENIPNENNLETLKKDLGELKDDLVTVKDDLEKIKIHDELIEELSDLEQDLTLIAEKPEKQQIYDEVSNTMIHRMYKDIQNTLNQESNEQELILNDDNPQTIYFDENLIAEELGEDKALSASNIDALKISSDSKQDVSNGTKATGINTNDNLQRKDVENDAGLKAHPSHSHPIENATELKPHYSEHPKSHSDEHHDDTSHAPIVKSHSDDVTHQKEHASSHSDEGKNLASHVSHSKPSGHLKSALNESTSPHPDSEEHPKSHSLEHAKTHSEAAGHAKTKVVRDSEKNLQTDHVKLNHYAITWAKEIMESRKNIAHNFIDVEVDVSELVSLLSIMREAYLSNELELTLLPFYIKAVYNGLKKFPILNASFINKENAILLKWFYNLAFSVDLDAGVKRPVLYNLQDESIKAIAAKVTTLMEQTINDKLNEKDYREASFSIINYGEYGITRGTFTIPEDNVAAIAMGIIFKKPVVVEKNDITIRDIMVITLGYNEAIIDVSEASKFVHYVAYLLSNPGLLL
ncbi:2-oxo acid dehydrogenase subunit E2 [Spiroplasma endosymbiont of Stenodema calcarata]|uniref:2-oxo acid dehydrogenase subunit E2 n=1 Tax=Spiroplasma endosymbiont of Stenodema calcarata TaxID=3139328 RepID=UPI003CCB3DBF